LPDLGDPPRKEVIALQRLLFHNVAAYGGVHVNVIRRNIQAHRLTVPRPDHPHETYYFYERNSGVTHFHVQAAPGGGFPVDQAAGLLAMHCMVRGQSPSDYIIMVQSDTDLLAGLTEKAEKLLQAGQAVRRSVKLTRREEEVLDGIMRSLANKEIAAVLNLSERTVKFHVSSLLAKFRVRGRMELAREASRHTTPAVPMPAPVAVATREARSFAPAAPSFRTSPPRAAILRLTKRQATA
jgi:DNA-binding CsgD family transcriptional regulator